MQSILLLLLIPTVAYLILVRALRFQRRNALLNKYSHYTKSPQALGCMTIDDAFDIHMSLLEFEFPSTLTVSVFFALFKTYGVPSISSLLVATGELSKPTPTGASKRTADTAVLLTEIQFNKPGTPRNLAAIARINWLHERYRRANKIKDDDMLYTLGLFALEGGRWIKRWEWRDLTDLERCAIAVCWKSLGEAMQIPYDALPSSPSGWVNGLEWLDELEAWSDAYEAKNMKPTASNRTLALATADVTLTNIPSFLKPLAFQFITALLTPRLRDAMMFDEPPAWVQNTLSFAINLRRWLLLHTFLPRPEFAKVIWTSEGYEDQASQASDKYYHFEQYLAHPWYVKPTLARRWNLNSWMLWLVGGYIPSDRDPKSRSYRPEGYKIADLGPISLEGKGAAEMEAAKATIRTIQQQGHGCPFYRG